MSEKIKILVVPSDSFGVGHWRSIWPHTKLQDLYGDDFDVEINMNPNWSDLPSFDKYDIIHFHKGVYQNMDEFRTALKYFKEHNITTIMDIDDYWDVGQFHPLFYSSRAMNLPEKITGNFPLVDYVTTTTEIFADKIKKFNKNVVVYPNAIDTNQEQFKPIKNPSDRIRFGFVMGSSHKRDMEQFQGVISCLGKDILDKIQIVLCGYDLKGSTTIIGKNGEVVGTRPIKPTESVWFEYERNVTNNYKIVSPEYKDFLFKFLPEAQWPNVANEPYRREWTKDLNSFGKHYRNIDVLLVPLETNQFSEVKSELKFVEAGFTKTAVVATNFGPYTIGSKSIFKKGGGLDETGNCILIDPAKKHKGWATAIKWLTNHPEYITLLQNNMYEHVKDQYNLETQTKRRAEWYKEIRKRNEINE